MDIPKDIDVTKLMNMLSQMDKKQVEEGLNKINQMLNNKNNSQTNNNLQTNNSSQTFNRKEK